MTTEKSHKFTVITNTELEHTDISTLKRKREAESYSTPPTESYHTNPMYEKLLEFKEKQKRKRFTVEDLLKWENNNKKPYYLM